MRILAISGSLKAASSNTSLVRAASRLAPESVEIIVYAGLADLPHFNPDLDDLDKEIAPLPVAHFRRQLRASDGVLISSPEYAHGVPGVLKNALDWLVGSGETVGKPFALINASPLATHAQESLTEILTTMAANIVAEASIRIPLAHRKLDESGIVSDPEISGLLRASIVALVRAIEDSRAEAEDV
ncbi:MAG: NAD(P)H-dependent oxidoreductase [Pyrinomonadaceae bacterium]|nr:NAD(P)H-dependent oxidoreductase [Pyrinomonadaceae bacterium]